MEITKELSLQEKLHILADAAKYDVACTSSGVDRKGKQGFLGNSAACGICHSFASDGRCISLLKILLTNHCIYDCKYCQNRVSNDIVRAAFTPQEVCEITIEFYKRNYIEGLFLSSGIDKNPTHTMEQICQVLYLLRTTYHFNGYIHVKAVPGAPDELLTTAGYLADRMSINLELPTEDGMRKLAPNKTHQAILRPMGQMTKTIAAHRLAIGKNARMERSRINQYLTNSIFSDKLLESDSKSLELPSSVKNEVPNRPFASAGQSTQMIIGATQETDYHLLRTTQYLYQSYDLKRVFFSAYVPLNEDQNLPALDTPVPLLREHRLYQADWLLRYYGFQAEELLSEERPNFNELLDPKCEWALRHLDHFPVEINHASYDILLRIPGIGPKSAARIVQACRYGTVDFPHLKKMGVVLKRAHYFITCSGKMMYKTPIEETYIARQLIGADRKENWEATHKNDYQQMSLFFDFGLQS
ncbi:MAG: putative DNA modification/repair radical SAM protein [Eubacteriales bacterium]|nr:putative DNA modification/repair radical SAM protein [Eubacteriales bacterium]